MGQVKLEGSSLWITGHRVMGPELLLSGLQESVGLSGVTTGSKTSSSTGSKSVSQGVGLGGGTTAGVCLRRDMGDSEASESL